MENSLENSSKINHQIWHLDNKVDACAHFEICNQPMELFV